MSILIIVLLGLIFAGRAWFKNKVSRENQVSAQDIASDLRSAGRNVAGGIRNLIEP